MRGEPVDSFGRFLHGLLDDLTAHDARTRRASVSPRPRSARPCAVCVVEVEDRLHELVNPRIVRAEGDDRDLEGCLSIPGYAAYVTRREKVWVVAQDRRGRKIKVAGSGLLGPRASSTSWTTSTASCTSTTSTRWTSSSRSAAATTTTTRATTPIPRTRVDRRGSGRRRSRDRDAGKRPGNDTRPHRGEGCRSARLAEAGAIWPARTVFFGSGAFAVPSLELLLAHPLVHVAGVVSAPDDPRKGAVPVARRARDAGLPLLQPRRLRDPASISAIEALRPEVGVLADYGRLVPPAIIALPRRGILNVHPSLLPRHRGASPIPAAIAGGDPETGVTIIAMNAGLDTGPIVASERRPSSGTETADELEAHLAADGARLLAATLAGWLAGDLTPRAQDEAGATLTRPLRREDGRLDPSRPAVELERQVRGDASHGREPSSKSAGGRVIVRRSRGRGDPSDRAARHPRRRRRPGSPWSPRTGASRLLEVQPAGGRAMSSAEPLLRGRPIARRNRRGRAGARGVVHTPRKFLGP